MSWDTNKNLSNELKTKKEIISSKDAEIQGLRAKVTTLTEEVNGLKYRLTLIDENAVERLRNAKNAETARADKVLVQRKVLPQPSTTFLVVFHGVIAQNSMKSASLTGHIYLQNGM